MNFEYIPKEQRKTILYICDDIRTHSGVATISKEIVLKSAHHFNWLILGGLHNHPNNNQRMDLSEEINKMTNLKDSWVHQIGVNGYGNVDLVKAILKSEPIDALMMMTDPRYYEWLFSIERDIRRKLPIMYLNIWDNYPYPMYNKSFYESCDALFCISKLTKNCVEQVLGEDLVKEKIIKYVPHGLDENIFKPLLEDDEDLNKFKKDLYNGKEYDFVVFWNSRNIRRKSPSDLMVGFKEFCDKLTKEQRSKVALLMHTDPIDPNGTDLLAVKKLLFGNDNSYNIIFTNRKYSPYEMNLLYNSIDVTALISSNEGWGLSLTESMLVGKCIIGNVTGGIQDQMRFEYYGKWIDFDKDFPSNNIGKYVPHGIWAFPIFPSNTSLVGSVPTPYIYDDRVQPSDIGKILKEVYGYSKTTLKNRGLEGREWAIGVEAKFTAQKMTNSIIAGIEETLEKFVPRKNFDVVKL
jgi:glycosyltransferase involved in cell wall biosynthesis